MEEPTQTLSFAGKDMVFLRPMKSYLKFGEGTSKARQCIVCNDLCNAHSFEAVIYPKGWNEGHSKIEDYCKKCAIKTFPNYFKKPEVKSVSKLRKDA